MLDLYYLLVEVTFGNLLVAYAGISLIFFVICLFARMSRASILFLLGSWTMVYTIGVFGALAAVAFMIGIIIWVGQGVLNLIQNM